MAPGRSHSRRRRDRKKGGKTGQFGSTSSVASVSSHQSATESDTTTSGVQLTVAEGPKKLFTMQFPNKQEQVPVSGVEEESVEMKKPGGVCEKDEENPQHITETATALESTVEVYKAEAGDSPGPDSETKPEATINIGSGQHVTSESTAVEGADGYESSSPSGAPSSQISVSTKSYKAEDPAAGDVPLPHSSPTDASSDSQETLMSLPPHLRAASRSRSRKAAEESASFSSKREHQTGGTSFNSSVSSRPSTANSQQNGNSSFAANGNNQWPQMGPDPRIINWKFTSYINPSDIQKAARQVRRLAAAEIKKVTGRSISPERVPFRHEERCIWGFEWVLSDTTIPDLWLPRFINAGRPEFVELRLSWILKRLIYMFSHNLITLKVGKPWTSKPRFSSGPNERYHHETPVSAPSKRPEMAHREVQKEHSAESTSKKEESAAKCEVTEPAPPKLAKQISQLDKKKTVAEVIKVIGGIEALDALSFNDEGSDYEPDDELTHSEGPDVHGDEQSSLQQNHEDTFVDPPKVTNLVANKAMSNEIDYAHPSFQVLQRHVEEDEILSQPGDFNTPLDETPMATSAELAPIPNSVKPPTIQEQSCDLQFHALIKEIQKMGATKIYETYQILGDWQHNLKRVPFRVNETSRFNFKWTSTNPNIAIPPDFLQQRMETMNPYDDKRKLVTVYWLLHNGQLDPAPIHPAKKQKDTAAAAASGRDHHGRDVSRGRSQMCRVEHRDLGTLNSVLNGVVEQETFLHDKQGERPGESSTKERSSRAAEANYPKAKMSDNRYDHHTYPEHEHQADYIRPSSTSMNSNKHVQLSDGEFLRAISKDRAGANSGGVLGNLASIAGVKRLEASMPVDGNYHQVVASSSRGNRMHTGGASSSGITPAKGRTVSNPIEISPQSSTQDSGVVVSPESSSSSKRQQKAAASGMEFSEVIYERDGEDFTGAEYALGVSPNSSLPYPEGLGQFQPDCNGCDDKDQRIHDLEKLVVAYQLQHKIITEKNEKLKRENESLKKRANGVPEECEFCKVSEDILENLYQMMKNWRPKNMKRERANATAAAQPPRDRERHDRDDPDRQHRSSRHHAEGRNRHGEGSSRQAEGSHRPEGSHHRSDGTRHTESRHHRSDSTRYAEGTRGESSRQTRSSRHVEGRSDREYDRRGAERRRHEANHHSSKHRVIQEEDEYDEVENPTEAHLIQMNHEVLGRTATGQLITKNSKGEVLFDSNYWPMPQQRPHKEGGKSLELIELERRSLLKYMKQPESKIKGAIHFGSAWDKMYYDDRILKSGQVRRAMARNNRKPLVYEKSSWDAPDNLKIPHDAEEW